MARMSFYHGGAGVLAFFENESSGNNRGFILISVRL